MDLEELRSFLHVVETGSFRAASDMLGVPRTTLRRRVDALEARAGVPLLESTQSGVVLTEAGRVLAKRGRGMVEEAGALLTSIRELGREPSGTLRLMLPVGLPPHLTTPLIDMARRAYPRLRVHCRFSNDPLAESLIDVDMAVHFGDTIPEGPWLSYVVLRVPVWLVASEGYLARRGRPASLDDLARHELFAWEEPGQDPCLLPLKGGSVRRIDPVLVSTDIHFIRHCCMSGLGVGLVPDALLPDPGDRKEALVPVLQDLVGRRLAVRVTVPSALAEAPKIKSTLDDLRAFLRSVEENLPRG